MIIHDKLTLTHIAQAHPNWWVGGRMTGDSSPIHWEHAHCSVHATVEWSPEAYAVGLLVSKRRPENARACSQCYRNTLGGYEVDESDD